MCPTHGAESRAPQIEYGRDGRDAALRNNEGVPLGDRKSIEERRGDLRF